MNRPTPWAPLTSALSEPGQPSQPSQASAPPAPSGPPGQDADAATELAGAVVQLRLFLELGAAQLDAAMRESDGRVEQLASTVGCLTTAACELNTLAKQLAAGDGTAPQPLHADIQRLTQLMQAHAQTAITALQFYDKLIQRLTHVRDGLAIPADSIAGGAQARGANWSKLLEQVRARYSTVEERVLFDFMLGGLSAEQMLRALSEMRASVTTSAYEPF
jgi:hypothetical protein